MTTKEKNVAMNLSVPKDLKEAFVELAYSLWTNSTNLIKMFMKQAIVTREVSFKTEDVFSDVVIEPLDTSDWWDEFNKKTEDNTKKLKTLLARKWK